MWKLNKLRSTKVLVCMILSRKAYFSRLWWRESSGGCPIEPFTHVHSHVHSGHRPGLSRAWRAHMKYTLNTSWFLLSVSCLCYRVQNINKKAFSLDLSILEGLSVLKNHLPSEPSWGSVTPVTGSSQTAVLTSHLLQLRSAVWHSTQSSYCPVHPSPTSLQKQRSIGLVIFTHPTCLNTKASHQQ